MATYIQRAVALTEALKGSALTAAEQLRVAQGIAKHYPQHFKPADPLNPTNAEYAQALIDSQREHIQEILVVQAESASRKTNDASVTAAGEAAKADL